ncbi:MAG: ATP-binding protein, partial [Bacteroidaceae bacterium]|nr:ATP-binding protein [Bacteroidaceae bacterium]
PSTRPPKIVLIGQEGVGKSTAGAKMPNPVFLCGESGLVGPQFADTPSFTPTSWAESLAFCEELASNPSGYKTLVIDTLDWIEPMLYAHVVQAAKKNDIKHIEDFGYGKGYVIAQQEARKMLAVLDKVNAAGMAVLILSHSQLKTVKNPEGDDYDHFESRVNTKVAGIFKEWSDAVLFARFEIYVRKDGMKVKAQGGTERIVQTTHSAAWDAKNRYGLPEVMDLDMSEIYIHIVSGNSSGEMLEAIKTAAESMEAKTKEATLKWCESGPTPYAIYEAYKKLNNKKEGK